MTRPRFRKILLVQTAFLGDVILATSLVEKLSRFYPEARLDFLLRKGNEGVLDTDTRIGKLWVWNKKKDKYRNLFRLIGQIRKEKYDLVVNMQRFGATGLLTALSGGKIRTGFDKNPFSIFFTYRVRHEFREHEIDRNLLLVERFTDGQRQKPRLLPLPAHYERTKPLKTDPYICVAPASVWFTKQYPLELWAAFLNGITRPLKVYFVGAPSDDALVKKIISEVYNPQLECHNLAGRLNIQETATLMQDAVMNYTNDSAPLHIASAMNAPVSAFFCSTLPEFGFGPLSDDSHIFEIREKLYCRPCTLHGKSACPEGHFRCATGIRPVFP